MYKHILMERGQIFEEGVSLPKSAPHACAIGLNIGNKLGMLACAITAKTAVAIAAGKKVTVSFQHADSNTGTYSDHSTHTVTLANALNVGPGGIVARVVLPPDARRWLKAVVSCDDTAATGSVNVFVEYLAR
jgi:hypothetical protein